MYTPAFNLVEPLPRLEETIITKMLDVHNNKRTGTK